MSDESRATGVSLEREESGGGVPGKADLIREAKAAFARGQGEPYLGDLSRLADHPDGDWDSAAEAALLLGHYYRGAYGGSYANSPHLDRVRYCGERAKALCRQADGAGLIAVAEIETLGEMTTRRQFESLVWPMTGAEAYVEQNNIAAGWLLKAVRGDCLFAMRFLYDNSDLADWMAGCNVEGHKDNYLNWGLYYLAYRRISQHPDADPLLRLEAADRATLLLRNVMSFCRKNYKRKSNDMWDVNNYLLTVREHHQHFENQAAIAMEADPQGEDWNLLSRIADVLNMDMHDVKALMKKNGYVPPQPKNADEQAAPVKTEGAKADPAKKDAKIAAASKDTGGPLKTVWKMLLRRE